MPFSSFENFLNVPSLRAAFVERVPSVRGDYDKLVALDELQPYHEEVVGDLGFAWPQVRRAEQVHGCEIAEVGRDGGAELIAGVDGLMTDQTGVCLGIYTADCAAVYLADPVTGAIALLHSGRRGSEGGIVSKAVGKLSERYGVNPADLRVVVSPCIRPPHYETDFSLLVRESALDSGVRSDHFQDEGVCTSDLKRFYSYRLEKGCTGRMLALMGRDK